MQTHLAPDEAATLLRAGRVIAYPTEGVWGLGCDPRNEAAVLKLLAIKERPVEKGMILIAADLKQLRPWLSLDALPVDRLAEALGSWPGPHTWILPASADAPRWITGEHDGIAVRISAHPPVIALCNAFGGPLVSTSANLSGRPAPRERDEFDPELLARIDGITTGETGGLQRPTPIRDARSGAVLR